MGLSLAGPAGVSLGLRALRWLACVDPVTDASGFPYRPSFDGGLGRCTEVFSCGRRHLPLRVGGRTARGVYSHSPGNGSSGGIRLGNVIASDVGDTVRLGDLRGVRIPYYDANPANVDDFILDWEDFAEEVVGEMRQDARDKWARCTFPHRLASELKADICDQVREKRISTEELCLDWLQQEEGADAPNQNLDDLWSIPLDLERGGLRLRDWRRYLRKYRQLLKQGEDWSESSDIRHLLRDALPSYWRNCVEDEEKKRAKKRLAVRIMSPEGQHPRIMEYFRRNLGELDRMMSMKNSVYVEVFGDTAGGRLLRLKTVEWRCGEKLRMQMIPGRMSLDSIVQYLSMELKLNSKNEAHIKDHHGNGNGERCDDRNYPAIQEDPTVGGDRSQDPGSADGKTSSGGQYMTPEDHEDAHFVAFVAHNTKAYGHDKGKWRKAPPRQGKEPRRIGNPPLSFTECRREHGGCWVCCAKGRSHKHAHKTSKVYEEDKPAHFQADPETVPKEKRIDEWKKRQADGG